ncbi:MAG: hypothetical protein ABSA05_13945 [Opitutaceae bacterium]|jgi:tetratricopeptide (TPR) repeat protein
MTLEAAIAMPTPAELCRVGVLVLLAVGLVAISSAASAEAPPPAAGAAPAKLSPSESLNPDELLRSYQDIQEQLRAVQQANVNNRLEAEAAARAQSAAIVEEIESIKGAMEAERERNQASTQKMEAEREREQAEAERSGRTILWLASGFGGFGLLAMLLTALFQWRALNRLPAAAFLPARLPQGYAGLAVPERYAQADQTVAAANQGLLATIGRMEQRILQLEHTTVQSEPTKPGRHLNQTASAFNSDPVAEQNARFAFLLRKGRTLLKANSVMEAMDCFDEILKADPNHAEALVKKGGTMELLKQNDEAIRYYDRAIQADPKMTLAYLCKAGLCNRLNRIGAAVECYEQAMRVVDEGNG